MRNVAGRLAALEAQMKPPEQVTIKIVYVDSDLDGNPNAKRLTWGDNPPVSRVAPGLLDLLQDDTAVTAPAAVSYPTGDDAERQPARAQASSPDGAGSEPAWNFEQARRELKAEQRREERIQRQYGRVRG